MFILDNIIPFLCDWTHIIVIVVCTTRLVGALELVRLCTVGMKISVVFL